MTIELKNRPIVTLVRMTAVGWLLLISAAVLIDHVALSNLTELSQEAAPATKVAAIETQLAELSQQLERQQRQPAAVPQVRYDADHQALMHRLATLEQARVERPEADNLRALEARLVQLEARPQPPQAVPTIQQPRSPTPAKRKQAEPAFRIIGAELRAGQRFVSILPYGETALARVRMLGPGEEEAGWLLDTVERDTAVFRHAGETHRLSIPTR